MKNIIILKDSFKTIPPSFEDGKVYLYKIINPEICNVDELWEYEILNEIKLNKLDKRKQQIFIRVIKLIQKLDKITYTKLYDYTYNKIKYVWGLKMEEYFLSNNFLKQRCLTICIWDKPEYFTKEEIEIYKTIKENEKIIGYEKSNNLITFKNEIKDVDIKRKKIIIEQIKEFSTIEKKQIIKNLNPLIVESILIEKNNNKHVEKYIYEIDAVFLPIYRLVKIYSVNSDYISHDYYDSGKYVNNARYEWVKVWGYKIDISHIQNVFSYKYKIENNNIFIYVYEKLIDIGAEFRPNRGLNTITEVLEEKIWDENYPIELIETKKDEENEEKNIKENKMNNKIEKDKIEFNPIPNTIYTMYGGSLVFKYISDKNILIANCDAEEYNQNVEFEPANEDEIKNILSNKKNWVKL